MVARRIALAFAVLVALDESKETLKATKNGKADGVEVDSGDPDSNIPETVRVLDPFFAALQPTAFKVIYFIEGSRPLIDGRLSPVSDVAMLTAFGGDTYV